MRRFVTNTALFTLIAVITLGAGELLVRSLPNSYRYKHEWILENAQEIEYLIMGSSHTYYGIAPSEFFPNSFNLANISQNPEYDLLLLKRYAPLCKNLHTIIIPVSYFTLFDKPFEEGDEWYYAINYRVYMGIEQHSRLSKYNFELSNRPVYSGKLLSFLSGKELPMCDTLGFGLGYTAADAAEWTHDAQNIAEKHTAADWDSLEKNVADMHSLLQFCKENGIRAILVTTPVSSAYRALLDNRQLEKTYSVIEEMCSRHGAEYHDYMADSRFTECDFHDSDHLSDEGAKKFTLILKEDLTKGIKEP